MKKVKNDSNVATAPTTTRSTQTLRSILTRGEGPCPFCGQPRPANGTRIYAGNSHQVGGLGGKNQPRAVNTIQREVEDMLALRKIALDGPDFDLADKLRWILKSQYGVAVVDTNEGQYWKFENTDLYPSQWTWFQHNRVLRELHG